MKKHNEKDERLSRRDFFRNTAKAILPILGTIVFTGNLHLAKAEEPNTNSTGCSGSNCIIFVDTLAVDVVRMPVMDVDTLAQELVRIRAIDLAADNSSLIGISLLRAIITSLNTDCCV